MKRPRPLFENYYDYRIDRKRGATDDDDDNRTSSSRRVTEKEHTIERLTCIARELEAQVHKRKKECHESELVFQTMRQSVARTMGFHTPQEKEVIIRGDTNRQLALFCVEDVSFHIIAHLFTRPLRLDMKGVVVRPSYANCRALRDLGNLMRTCHYANDTLGSVIRKNMPPLSSIIKQEKCGACHTSHVKCRACKTQYCLACDVDRYPRHKCTACQHVNILCECRRHIRDEALSIKCFQCKKPIKNSSFT